MRVGPRYIRSMLRNALSAKRIAVAAPGKYRDGEGLQFEVKGGSRRWTFTYSWAGKPREIAIGTYPAMSLAQARDKRSELRDAKDRDIDPALVMRGQPIVDGPTFEFDMTRFVGHMQGQWVPGHRAEWINSMKRVAGPLMALQTTAITQADVLKVIGDAWLDMNVTAVRVLRRIEVVINHAAAVDRDRFQGFANPCLNIAVHLPRLTDKVTPRAAMPWREMPAFVARLRQRPETSARALEFLLLTCCPRSREVTQATWSEIAMDRWNVPGEHMKSGQGRVIPLTVAAAAALPKNPGPKGKYLRIFEIHDDAMQQALREMDPMCTVHGFRSTFMDWVAEKHPGRLLEAERALDHKIGNQVQRAYLRTNLLEQRRELAEMWALFLG